MLAAAGGPRAVVDINYVTLLLPEECLRAGNAGILDRRTVVLSGRYVSKLFIIDANTHGSGSHAHHADGPDLIDVGGPNLLAGLDPLFFAHEVGFLE